LIRGDMKRKGKNNMKQNGLWRGSDGTHLSKEQDIKWKGTGTALFGLG